MGETGVAMEQMQFSMRGLYGVRFDMLKPQIAFQTLNSIYFRHQEIRKNPEQTAGS